MLFPWALQLEQSELYKMLAVWSGKQILRSHEWAAIIDRSQYHIWNPTVPCLCRSCKAIQLEKEPLGGPLEPLYGCASDCWNQMWPRLPHRISIQGRPSGHWWVGGNILKWKLSLRKLSTTAALLLWKDKDKMILSRFQNMQKKLLDKEL